LEVNYITLVEARPRLQNIINSLLAKTDPQ